MLAVSRMTVRGADSIGAEVYTIIAGSQPIRLYQDPPGVIPLIADNTPHYLYWSPDSRHLTFLAKGAQNLDLFVSSIDDPEVLVRVINGAPLYWAWAADSLSMLLHVGDAVLLLDFTTPAGPKEVGSRSTAFRAPAWSPVSGQMAYIDQTAQGGNALFVADQDGRDGRPVVDVGEGTAFLWSPAGNSIALLDTDVPSDPDYRALRMVDLESGAIRTLTSEQVVAFFWSPNGEKIAYVAFDPLAQRLSWKVLDLEQGQPRKLVDFIPTQDMFLMLAFFDQYAYSNSLWSPDSQYLVFTGRLRSETEGSSESNDTAVEDRVYVVDVDDPSGLQAIAEGSLAFWSWN
jgi:TolB protein